MCGCDVFNRFHSGNDVAETITKHYCSELFFFIWAFRLCTLNGHPVSGPTELENNHYYVAVGSEKFKALPYYQCVPRRDLLRENNMTEGYEMWSFMAFSICPE